MWRRPLYPAWLGMVLLTGRLALPSRDPSPTWRPGTARGRQWIDWEKEANMAVISNQNGHGTCQMLSAEDCSNALYPHEFMGSGTTCDPNPCQGPLRDRHQLHAGHHPAMAPAAGSREAGLQ